MNDDLIRREEALEAVKIPNGEYSNPSERHGIIIARVEARRRIMDIPAVESVKVVRCGECLHWEPECVEEGDSSGHCRNNYAPCQNQQTDMNWFCAEGERNDAP